jgi:hypothetical protein
VRCWNQQEEEEEERVWENLLQSRRYLYGTRTTRDHPQRLAHGSTHRRRSWSSGMMIASHAIDSGSIPGGRSRHSFAQNESFVAGIHIVSAGGGRVRAPPGAGMTCERAGWCCCLTNQLSDQPQLSGWPAGEAAQLIRAVDFPCRSRWRGLAPARARALRSSIRHLPPHAAVARPSLRPKRPPCILSYTCCCTTRRALALPAAPRLLGAAAAGNQRAMKYCVPPARLPTPRAAQQPASRRRTQPQPHY